ncbi:LysR substrate-binding domain-containing protein [Variovorax ureilyticus]|uniref:LysR substrate-binding domain-containing protein n=1 Tax=Variovorax ureilyticus TaxID=1836198 RepID=A0ABU8VB48_9BURK
MQTKAAERRGRRGKGIGVAPGKTQILGLHAPVRFGLFWRAESFANSPMPRHLPSTRALQIFSAIARHQSLSQAAEELCLTHSALSQQMQKLEQQLGVKLLRRTTRGVSLTEVGQRFRANVDSDLLQMQTHMMELMSLREGEISLVVGVVPVLADRWLLPRLARFLQQQPRVSVTVREFPNKLFVGEPQFDVALHYGDAIWPGTRSQPLFEESCVAVCSPHAPFAKSAAAGDFRRVPLLHLSNRPEAWQGWFADAGLARSPANALAGHRFDLFSTLLEAVRAGLGAGLVPTFVAERELRTGELARVHRHLQKRTHSYAVFLPDHRASDECVAAFVRWLRQEVLESEFPDPGSVQRKPSGEH